MDQTSLNVIVNAPIVRTTIQNIFGAQKTEIVERPASFIIRLKQEPEESVLRIILLPPHGFTANHAGETNPHPEARSARIEIKGGVKPHNTRFSLVKKAVRYQYYTLRNVKLIEDEPYPKINREHYQELTKSSKDKFFVVQEDGVGFYHSLVNLSSEWILLILKKELKFQRIVNLEPILHKVDKKQQEVMKELYEKILSLGDALFEREKDLIKEVCSGKVSEIIPALLEMLNVTETGKHEACTVYAIILKIGKKDKMVLNYLKEAQDNKIAPKYYVEELIGKLSKVVQINSISTSN